MVKATLAEDPSRGVRRRYSTLQGDDGLDLQLRGSKQDDVLIGVHTLLDEYANALAPFRAELSAR